MAAPSGAEMPDLTKQFSKDIFWTFTILGGLIVTGGLFVAAHVMALDPQKAGIVARLSGIGGALTFAVGLATKFMFETLDRL